MTKIGQLKIWHFPNLGSRVYFREEVASLTEAKLKLKLLADYDLILGDLIHSNAQGLEVYVGTDVDYETNDGWEEWEDENGNNIGDDDE